MFVRNPPYNEDTLDANVVARKSIRRCRLCIDPYSKAGTYAFFTGADTKHMYCHPVCFGEFAIWHETQENLLVVFTEWRKAVSCYLLTTCRRAFSVKFHRQEHIFLRRLQQREAIGRLWVRHVYENKRMVFVTWLTVCRLTIAGRRQKQCLNQAGRLVRLWQMNAIVYSWCRICDSVVAAAEATSDSSGPPEMQDSSSSGGDADERAESTSIEDDESSINEYDLNMTGVFVDWLFQRHLL